MKDFDALLNSITIPCTADYIREKANDAGIDKPKSINIYLRFKGYSFSRGKWVHKSKVQANFNYGSKV